MLLTLLALAALAAPDSWMSPRAKVIVSESGRHAVVLVPQGRRAARYSFFAQRGPSEASKDAPLEVPVQELLSSKNFERPRLIGSTSESTIARRVVVSDEGHGFVAIGRHGGERGGGKTLMTFDSDGEYQGGWSVEDIEKVGGKTDYPGTVTIISWCRSCWIDEETGEAVMTSTLDQVFVAPLDGSKLRVGGLPELKRGLLQRGDRKQQSALDALAQYDCPELVPEYVKLTAPTFPMATRLRAARALYKAGDKSAGPLVMGVALQEVADERATIGDITLALEELHHYASADVVMVLKERLRLVDNDLLEPRTKALGRYGPESAPLLIEMLQEADAPLHYRRAAAAALGEAGDAASIDALMGATQDPDQRVALNALRSISSIGGESVGGRLLPLLGTRSHFTGHLLYYFSNHRHPAAKAKLEAFLATKDADWLRKRIEKAIRFQTGEGEADPPKKGADR